MKTLEELKRKYPFIVDEFERGTHVYPVVVGVIRSIAKDDDCTEAKKVYQIKEVLELLDKLE